MSWKYVTWSLRKDNKGIVMEKVMIDTTEYQQRVLECIGSEEVNKFFGTTMFVNLPESSMCKQAMIHGMAIASMMTSQCNPVIVEERPVGHWLLLDECANEGVYCSVCNKKVYKKHYANQKVKSKFCPNCGTRMEE